MNRQEASLFFRPRVVSCSPVPPNKAMQTDRRFAAAADRQGVRTHRPRPRRVNAASPFALQSTTRGGARLPQSGCHSTFHGPSESRGRTMILHVEIEQEVDGRWLAEVTDLPGVMAYGVSRPDAVARVQALALRSLAERLEHGEAIPEFLQVAFEAA